MSLKVRASEDQRIAEAQKLVEDVERVEFKLTVRDTERASAIEALDLDVLDAELRQVVFFDTPDLRLNRGGLVVRARRIRKGGDTTVKTPARISSASFSASRRSVLMRSPGLRGMSDGAITSHTTPTASSRRCKLYPQVPAS